jgi:anti-anti-sigma regulatory factor
MNHRQSTCRNHALTSRMPVEAFAPGVPTAASRKSLYPWRRVDGVAQVQTMVLISFDGVLDGQSGKAMRASVQSLLDLGIRSIFLDLWAIDRVEASGVFHLAETLKFADARGGGVTLLESSVAVTSYLGDA